LFFSLFAFFLFYELNYRTLIIRLSKDALQLKFGIFTWIIPLHNIETCFPDATSLWRIGGEGIHFTPLGGRYRAMFNFLEHPRVVITLKTKRVLVRVIAFVFTSYMMDCMIRIGSKQRIIHRFEPFIIIKTRHTMMC
jgi:hypothetical protein